MLHVVYKLAISTSIGQFIRVNSSILLKEAIDRISAFVTFAELEVVKSPCYTSVRPHIRRPDRIKLCGSSKALDFVSHILYHACLIL